MASPSEGPLTFFQRLRERKLVPWLTAYLAGALVVFGVFSDLADRWGWAATLQPIVDVLLVLGFVSTFVLAWFHGEKGVQRVRGLEAAILVLLVALGGVFVVALGPSRSAGVPLSIAVLPFENLSSDPGYEFFADGLHDELITNLGKGGLSPISRTSVMQYANTAASPRQIAEELAVAYLVEASVQVLNGSLRVNARLIDPATGDQLWADTYDRLLGDAFAIQSEIAERIVSNVGATVARSVGAELTSAPTGNSLAYQLYLQAKTYENRAGHLLEDMANARALLQQALSLDRDFALAHAALSRVSSNMFWYGLDASRENADLAFSEAQAALDLEPDLAEGHAALGTAHYWIDRDYGRALEELRRAIEIQPANAETWEVLGYVHRRLGNWDSVFVALERARPLNPLSPDLTFNLGGVTSLTLRRYSDATRYLDDVIALTPDHHLAKLWRAEGLLRWRGDLEPLREAVLNAPQDLNAGNFSALKWALDLAFFSRMPDSAVAVLEEMPKRGERLLNTALARRLQGDHGGAAVAFDSARAAFAAELDELTNRSDSQIRVGSGIAGVAPLHAGLGLALAALGRDDDAVREAEWLRDSPLYHADAQDGPIWWEARARILAEAGLLDEALGEIKRLLSSYGIARNTPQAMRLDPWWDSLRSDVRFETLLEEYDQAN